MASNPKNLDYDAIHEQAKREAAATLASERERLEKLERTIEESRQRLEQRLLESHAIEPG